MELGYLIPSLLVAIHGAPHAVVAALVFATPQQQAVPELLLLGCLARECSI